MFNSPALDIALGLVFIFLLYSLLATSIQEAIATAFNLRASMLKKSIVENMLADTADDSHIVAWWKEIKAFVQKLPSMVGLAKKTKDTSLGGRFYDHPLIKNYGESKMFPIPSYIPTKNFSAVLLDILLKDFNTNLDAIAAFKKGVLNDDVDSIKEQLKSLPQTYKVKELLEFHLNCFERDDKYKYFLECDTCRILEMHLRNSLYDVEAFSKRLEGWFDDSMRRVSGWYKRESQIILFVIGLAMAFTFNVDILKIAGKLSTDKDARDKLVTMAINAADKYKDDPRVKKIDPTTASATELATLEEVKAEYEKHSDEAKNLLKGDVKDANELLALGWNEFGRHEPAYLNTLKAKYKAEIPYTGVVKKLALTDQEKLDVLANDSIQLARLKKQYGSAMTPQALAKIIANDKKQKQDSIATDNWYLKVKAAHPIKVRSSYVFTTLGNNPRSFLGYLILAFSICLGAPFWFDLLGKLVNIRGAGKKEAAGTTAPSTAQEKQPVQIAINNTKDGEEAVG